MRRVDRWAGVPLCFVLTCARRVGSLLRWTQGWGHEASGPRRIAFVKLAEQGATVLAGPAIREAVDRVGAENVFFVVFEENRPILDFMELIPPENVIAIRTGGMVQAMMSTLGAVRRMRWEGVDTAIDFEFFARSSAAICYLSGARTRIGFHGFVGETPYRGDLMTHRLSFNPQLHASEIFRLQVKAMDARPEDLPAFDLKPGGETVLPPVFEPSADELEKVAGVLREQLGGAEGRPLILLNANCSDLLPLRKWPQERYVELSRRLLERYPEVSIAFTGAPSERDPVERLVREIGSKRICSMAGRTTLRELLVLYCLAEVMVTNDSGPAHFASLTPMDVVTLFGPETPAVFGVRSPRSHVLWANLVCSPCVNAYNNRLSGCQNNICMQKIAVDQVFDKVCEVYERRRARAKVGERM